MGGLTLTLHRDFMVIDGVAVSYDAIPQLISAITRPDPRKWFRFERSGDNVMVHVKITEDEHDGTRLANIGSDAGRREEDSGQQGQEATHP